ncbi:MAG: hypothetical protein AB7W16_08920 [Candidatus Obscuribacterales bacterium]
MTTTAGESRIESAPRHAETGDAGRHIEHIDRLELFKSDRSGLQPQQASARPDRTDPEVLDFSQNDPLAGFAALDSGVTSGDLTRGVKGKARASETGDKSAGENTTGKTPGETAEPFKILDDTSNLDPNKPTVLFLDQFNSPHAGQLFSDPATHKLTIATRTEIPVNQVAGKTEQGTPLLSETGFTHGEFSARMAKENGFNAVRVQQELKEGELTDFSKSLNGIADMVDSGKLNLGKGDVINVSLGNGDLDFTQLNTLLGSTRDNQITPENIGNPEVQNDILTRLDGVAKDPKVAPTIREWARNSVESNKAIERLQAKGIEVVHAAANTGPGSVSIEFLKANHELSSVDPTTGKPDKFTTVHGHTTEANGVLPIRFQPGTELGGQREGKYTVEGTGVTFRGSEFGNLNMQETVAVGGDNVPRDDASLKEAFEKIGREAPPRNNENGFLVAVASGNSFANVQFLASQRERLAAMKKASH